MGQAVRLCSALSSKSPALGLWSEVAMLTAEWGGAEVNGAWDSPWGLAVLHQGFWPERDCPPEMHLKPALTGVSLWSLAP